MQLISVHLPQRYLQGIDVLCRLGVYPNRSELIRIALRDLLKEELDPVLAKPIPELGRKKSIRNSRIFVKTSLETKIAQYLSSGQNQFRSTSAVINRALEFFFDTLERNGEGL